MASVPQKLQDESFNHLFTHHEHLVISMSYKLVLKRECRNIQKSLQSDITKPELPGHFPEALAYFVWWRQGQFAIHF